MAQNRLYGSVTAGRRCHNKDGREKSGSGSLFLLFFLLILAIRPAGALGQAEDPQAPETVPAFLERLQDLLRNGDREGYLAFFAPRSGRTKRTAWRCTSTASR